MSSLNLQNQRVLSGMRPSGGLHLGHYHGVLKNWAKLQHEHECFFFVADWHVLTTHYDNPEIIEKSIWDMVIDWLAAGVNPGSATMFIQSQVPEHAELHLLLSMLTPLSWLERAPTYKEQQEKLKDKEIFFNYLVSILQYLLILGCCSSNYGPKTLHFSLFQ